VFVLSEVEFGGRKDDVLNMVLSIIENLFVVVGGVLFEGQELRLFLGVFVVFAHLPRRPQLPFRDVGEGSTKLDLQLRRVAELEQRLDDLLIQKVDLFDGLLIQKLLDYPPNEGDGSGHPGNIAHKHPGTIGIRQEGETLLHGAN